MVSEVPEPTLDALTRFGLHLGMCFQIVDDVLDLTATDEALGKPAGQDLLEGVYTLPVIYALRDTPALGAQLGHPLDPDELAEARRVAAANGAVDTALGVARGHAAKALDALEGADALDPRVCSALNTLADGQVTRSADYSFAHCEPGYPARGPSPNRSLTASRDTRLAAVRSLASCSTRSTRSQPHAPDTHVGSCRQGLCVRDAQVFRS